MINLHHLRTTLRYGRNTGEYSLVTSQDNYFCFLMAYGGAPIAWITEKTVRIGPKLNVCERTVLENFASKHSRRVQIREFSNGAQGINRDSRRQLSWPLANYDKEVIAHPPPEERMPLTRISWTELDTGTSIGNLTIPSTEAYAQMYGLTSSQLLTEELMQQITGRL